MSFKKKKLRHQQKNPPAAELPILQLKIDTVAFGGDGIARHEGKVYFVADALPGQVVAAAVSSNKSSYAKAQAVHLIEDAPYTRKAPCAYAAQCGGCQWQQAPYERQVEWKAEFIRSALQRIGGFTEGSHTFTMQAATESLLYRNRIDLKSIIHCDGSFALGYFAKGSHQLVAIDACLIAEPLLSEAIVALKTIRFKTRKRPFESSIELQVMHAGTPKILLHLSEWPSELATELRQVLAENTWLAEHVLEGEDSFPALERWKDLIFHTQAGQFQQVNRQANHVLRQYVLEQAQRMDAKLVFDLYCGSGNLSLALAAAGIRVCGIESYAPAIRTAEKNVRVNKLEAVADYKTGEADQFETLFGDLDQAQLVIVDPPRRGLAEAIETLLKIDAENLIYVSCDPNTLARDLKRLTESVYELKEVMGLDFFPQTYHVETVCVLKKRH